MANPLFEAMRGNTLNATPARQTAPNQPAAGQAINRQNLMQKMRELRANPVQFLKGLGYNVPDNLANDPVGIMQHLASTNQFNQQQMSGYQQLSRRR